MADLARRLTEGDWRYFAGPHLSAGIDNLGGLARALAGVVGPQADVKGMVDDAGASARSFRGGDYGGALANAMMAGAALPMMALPGTVSEIKGIGRRQIYDIMRPSWKNTGDEMVSAFRNPTRSDVGKEIRRNGYLRVVLDRRSGDVYAWPGDEGLHEETIRKLGLGEMSENLGTAHSLQDFLDLVAKAKSTNPF